jgi:hypothetical protein
MQPTEPSGLRDDAFISYAAHFVSEGGMPLAWQKEMLKRYLFYFALLQEIGSDGPSAASSEQLYIL